MFNSLSQTTPWGSILPSIIETTDQNTWDCTLLFLNRKLGFFLLGGTEIWHVYINIYITFGKLHNFLGVRKKHEMPPRNLLTIPEKEEETNLTKREGLVQWLV